MNDALKEWVRVAPADDFWLWAIGLTIATIAGFFSAFTFIHRKRIIQDTPTSKIRSAAQGYLELIGVGQLMEGQPIVSPLTSKSCTWFHYHVEEKRGSGKNSKWVTVRKETSDNLFLLKDDTGHCVIDPEGAKVTVNDKRVWYGHSANPPTTTNNFEKKSTLGKFTASFTSGFGRYRYTEKLLHPDENLYAIGFYKTVGGAGAKFDINEDVRELIREWKNDTNAIMKRFDENKDGEIDLNEWQKVRDEAYKEVVKKHSHQKTLPPIHLMEKTNDRRRPYILSAVEQDDLTRRLHYFSVLSIGAFLICGSLATWLISLRLAT